MIVKLTDQEIDQLMALVQTHPAVVSNRQELLKSLQRVKDHVVISTITKKQAAAWDALKPHK